MKNKEQWTETKFVKTDKGYIPSRDPQELSISSRFIALVQIKFYSKLIKQHARGILLDLGCGKVPFYEMYREDILDNICIDWTNTLHKNPYLDYEFDLNSQIPLESNQFDTILATDVLEHISKPDLLMSEIARLLKPSGKVILAVPFFYWLHEQPHDYFRYTEFALKMFCQENQLKILVLKPYGGAPEILLDIVGKLLLRPKFISSIYSNISIFFAELKLCQQLSNKTSKSFPLGYCLVAQKL